ncbi:MAG TPA: hypothetical protein VHM90_17305 [Phycisphaerae bacterium]|nr:hypothetical protein [Phycisphaerae bacterium]
MIDQKQMMIHVERIVRPVRATEGRKLQMRRELLAHLHLALEEETTSAGSEENAWEAARVRLGDPAALTRAMQRSVPPLERILLAYLPLGARAHRLEKRMSESMGMGGMSMFQGAVFTFGTAFLTLAAVIPLALRVQEMHRDIMRQRLSDQLWQFQLGNFVCGLLLILFAGSCFAMAGSAARGETTRRFLRRAAWSVVFLLAWQTVLITMAAGQALHWQDLAWAAASGVLLAPLLALLGRLTARVGHEYHDWLGLDIAR